MDEDATVDTRNLRKLVVAEAAPGFRESLAALEALRRNRYRLDAPLTTCLVRVDYVDRLLMFGNGEVAFQLEEMLLRPASMITVHNAKHMLTFQGA